MFGSGGSNEKKKKSLPVRKLLELERASQAGNDDGGTLDQGARADLGATGDERAAAAELDLGPDREGAGVTAVGVGGLTRARAVGAHPAPENRFRRRGEVAQRRVQPVQRCAKLVRLLLDLVGDLLPRGASARRGLPEGGAAAVQAVGVLRRLGRFARRRGGGAKKSVYRDVKRRRPVYAEVERMSCA